MLKPTAFLLLAGLAVGQAQQPGVSQEDVKRLAERLARMDVGGAVSPLTPDQLEMIKKLLEQNPAFKKQVDEQIEKLGKLPPAEQKKQLDDLKAKAQDPALKKQLEQLLPNQPGKSAKDTSPKSRPDPTESRPDKSKQTPRPNPTPGPESKGDSKSSSSPPQPQPRSRFEPTDEEKGPPSAGMLRPKPAELPAAGSQQKLPAPNGSKGFEKFARMWEENVGPLKDMPAVQQLAQELFKGRSDSSSGDGGTLGDLLDPKTASNLLKGLPEPTTGPGGNWNLPDLSGATGGVKAPPLPNTSFSAPSAPSAGGVGLVLGLLFLAGLVFAVFKLLPKLTATADPRPVPGLGPWPLDPRTVETRADLVRAFEYLSVLLNGDPARTYSHEAAAAALRQAVPDAADAAGPLAEAYALARYTPSDHPFTPDEIAAARRHLCRLAGVPAP